MIGQSVGGYQIVAQLGEGGMGVVYLGEHRRIARKAAVKVLRADLTGNAEILERFFNEARATSMIRHPGIVEILDCDVLPEGHAYIVMELLAGESLASLLAREGRLAVPRALGIARQIADALAAAHERGIVHRDLKPDNIFLVPVPSGGGDSVKILDFGIAKLTNPDLVGGQRMTHTGRLLGTPLYMSPEQCRGARDVDVRTDVYSLGCILYELLSGRPPFNDPGFGELVLRHLTFVPARVRTLAAEVPPAVDELVARMLAKAPTERPQSMVEVVAEIDRLGGAPSASGRVSLGIPPTIRMVGGPRVATPAVGSRPLASGTTPPSGTRPSSTGALPVGTGPSVQTTLRSAAGEHLPVSDADPSTIDRPLATRRRAAGPMIALAVAGAVAAMGVVVWQLRSPGGGDAAVGSRAPAAAATPAPAPTPTLAPAPPAAAATPPPPPPAAAAAAIPAAPVAAPEPAPAAADGKAADAPAKVRISITSTPSDADVCFARDNAFLGRTRYDWSAERGSRVAKLWVRKPGYHGQQIAVSLEHDAKKHVDLKKLGPDDIEDVETCRH